MAICTQHTHRPGKRSEPQRAAPGAARAAQELVARARMPPPRPPALHACLHYGRYEHQVRVFPQNVHWGGEGGLQLPALHSSLASFPAAPEAHEGDDEAMGSGARAPLVALGDSSALGGPPAASADRARTHSARKRISSRHPRQPQEALPIAAATLGGLPSHERTESGRKTAVLAWARAANSYLGTPSSFFLAQ